MTNTQKKIFILVLLIFGCVLTGVISEYSNKTAENNSKSFLPREELNFASKKASVLIYVSGAVVKPGLYELSPESRADAAIKAAGGFTEPADLERVNLAKKLKDGMQVNVPTKKSKRTVSPSSKNKNIITASSSPKTSTGKNQAKSLNVININTASAAELEQVPGIGPVMAQKIIAYRENRKFVSVEDLLKVKGVGKATLGRMKEYVKAE